jgi:hypothetical protein
MSGGSAYKDHTFNTEYISRKQRNTSHEFSQYNTSTSTVQYKYMNISTIPVHTHYKTLENRKYRTQKYRSNTYIPSFIKIGSGTQKLMRGDLQTHRQHGQSISLL